MSLELINYDLRLAGVSDSPPPQSPNPIPSETKLNAAWRVVLAAPPGMSALRMIAEAWKLEAAAATTASSRDAALAASKSANDKIESLRAKANP